MTIIENHRHTFAVEDIGDFDLDQDRSICVPDNDNKKLMIEDYKKWRAIIKNAL